MQSKKWQPLKAGDTVDIIAPASRVTDAELEKIHSLLLSWQLVPRSSLHIFADGLLCANSDEQRLLQLKTALLDETSAAVWCVRGGYGATRLLPALMQLTPPAHPKLFMGFSDITALHIFLQQQWGWQTLHAPSARQVSSELIPQENIRCLQQIIFGERTTYALPVLHALNALAQCDKKITAPIVGGNLSLLQASVGTAWQLKTAQKILFLEEVGERAYRVDRILTHLQQAGLFTDVAAVLFGDFVGCEDPDGQSRVADVLQAFARDCAFPVLQCAGIGHGAENYPLPLNTLAVLQLGIQPSAQIEVNSS